MAVVLMVIALYGFLAVLLFYILYRVIRVAVRDGIRDAQNP